MRGAHGGAAPWEIVPAAHGDAGRLAHDLRERVKELNCLYAIARIVEEHPNEPDEILRRVAERLPPAWQYPERACARIVHRGRVFASEGFVLSIWRQSAPLSVGGEPAGEVTVCYTAACPPAEEGPFLREERVLIQAVAGYLGLVMERISAEQDLQETNRQLRMERQALADTNTALRTVLTKIGEEKEALGRDIHANVERVLMPILHALALDVPPERRAYVDLLKRSLGDLTAPFVSRLTASHPALTPTEVAICGMIRQGVGSKEIARLRGISPATVSRHREHIRRKMGLAGRSVNLTTVLQGDGAGKTG